MDKNVCIIHFNTPVLTAHLVKSINKHTPGTNIYIFDNSDDMPFINTFDNVTVFNNTKGQIINFDQWLKKYPNKDKSGGKANKWGSAKHAYSVEKCMELIREPFILFDSDVLVKKDFSSLYDNDICYKGEVITQPGTNNRIKRVLPFICFINTPLCIQKGIHYFDENYMHGLRYKGMSDNYDTGGALYILTEKKKAPHKEIKVADYIVHYGNGSWVDAAEKMRKPKHIPAMEWLNVHKACWNEDGKKTHLNKSFSDVFDHIYCLHYLPALERLPKIKEEFKRVGIDENAAYFSWVYDYPTTLLDLVYDNKKINMSLELRSSSRDYLKRVALKHYEIIKEAYCLGYEKIMVTENDIRFHKDLDYLSEMLENMPDSDIILFDKMTSSAPGQSSKYTQYVNTLKDDALYGNVKDSGVFFIFSSCYVLNRKAMGRIIKLQESGLLPPDTPLNDPELNISFAVINLAIQDPKLKTRNGETYDKIGLDVSKYNITEPPKVTATVKSRPVLPTPKKIVSTPVKRTSLLDKRRQSRLMYRKTVGYNKLYDVI